MNTDHETRAVANGCFLKWNSSSNSAQLMRFKLCEEYWQGIAKKSRLLTLVCRAFNQERSIRNHQQHVEFTDNESTIEANKASNRRTTTKQTTRDSEDYTTRHRKSSSDVMVKSIVLYPCACDLNCIFMCCYFPSNRTSHCIVLIIEMLGKDNGFLPPPSHTVREK